METAHTETCMGKFQTVRMESHKQQTKEDAIEGGGKGKGLQRERLPQEAGERSSAGLLQSSSTWAQPGEGLASPKFPKTYCISQPAGTIKAYDTASSILFQSPLSSEWYHQLPRNLGVTLDTALLQSNIHPSHLVLNLSP
jgi:hypothetical protein